MTRSDFHRALTLIQMEYVEMPELKLTLRQAARLWALHAEPCQQALDALIAGGFLVQTRDGAYVRRGTPPVDVEQFSAPARHSLPAAL
jgi:hypothetical protein